MGSNTVNNMQFNFNIKIYAITQISRQSYQKFTCIFFNKKPNSLKNLLTEEEALTSLTPFAPFFIKGFVAPQKIDTKINPIRDSANKIYQNINL